MKKAILLFLLSGLILSGCGHLSAVRNEFRLDPVSSLNVEADTTKTKMVIFNSSNSFLYGPDGSGVIGLYINNKGFTKIDIGEYVQIIIPKGSYQFNLEHKDILVFKSDHIIDAFRDTTIVEINSTMTSNEAKVIMELPVDFFEDYKPHILTKTPMILQIDAKKN